MSRENRTYWPRLFGPGDPPKSVFDKTNGLSLIIWSVAHFSSTASARLHSIFFPGENLQSLETFSSGVSMENDAIVKGDKLILRGLKFHGYHGVKPEERKLGQKFLVDVDAWLDLQPAGKSDCLSDTVSYTDIYRIVKEVVEGPAHNLLESVAQLIASTTFTKHPQISAVRVVVGKPHVAVPGSVDYLGVEILRYRSVDASN